MGKHLIQKEKKESGIKLPELKLTKVKPVKDISSSAELDENKTKIKLPVRKTKGSGIAGIIASVLFLILIPLVPLEGWMLKLAYAIILFIASVELVWDVIDNIREKEYFSYENVIFISIILAYAIVFEFEAVLLALLYRVVKLVLAKTEAYSWEKLKSFSKIVPETAFVETSEGVLEVHPADVNEGDILIVDAGERIPLDGIIVDGISTIDTAAVSGQTTAWAVTEGYRVYSGCKNLTSKIKLRVTKNFDKSTAGSLVKMAQSSTEYYSRQQKFSVIVKRYYALSVFIAASLICIVLSLINGQWIENAQKSLILLIAAFSSASLAAVSMAYIRTIGNASETGIFVKGADCIESMAKAETMVFDKTGIITEGRYVITDVFPNKVSEQQLLTMAATAERFSKHPIAVVLKEAAGPLDIDYKALQIEEIPGRGISAFVGEKQVYVGNTALLEEHGIKCAVPTRSGAAIHVAVDYKYWGHILISDRIRRGAFDSLERLRANGVRKLVLLTGDVLSVAKPLASKLNFDMLRAELKPSEKVSAVDFLMSNRGDSTTLAFVGDGNSEAQIMNRVDVGIAIGALGADAAFSAADVLIMDRDIKKLPVAVSISRLAYRIVLENLLMWFGVNILVIALALIGVLPVLAAIIIEFLLICASFINVCRIK